MTIYLYALTCICSFKVCAILYYQCIYILNGTCAVVMHVQLQLCIIATSNLYNSYTVIVSYYHHGHFDLCMHTPCYFLLLGAICICMYTK